MNMEHSRSGTYSSASAPHVKCEADLTTSLLLIARLAVGGDSYG